MVKESLAKRFFLKTAAVFFIAVLCFAFDAGASGASPSLLDTASQECLKCHEGVGNESRHAGGSHSAGTAYAGSSNERAKLRSAPSPELELIDGRLSCVTCHAPYSASVHASPERGAMLVMSNEKSALCTACHDI